MLKLNTQSTHVVAYITPKFGSVTGEDMDMVGGAEADSNFRTLSDTSSCGKMTALAKLLHLWYHEGTANKVCCC